MIPRLSSSHANTTILTPLYYAQRNYC